MPEQDLPDEESPEPSQHSSSNVDAYAPTVTEQSAPSAPSLRPAFIAAMIGIGVALLAQLAAPATDYQNANMVTLASLLIATLFVVYRLQKRSRFHGSSWKVPIVVLGCLVGFFSMFQFQGFSGEMFPQFAFRFRTGNPPELRTTVAPAKGTSNTGETLLANVDDELPSPQFLGPDRNGVYGERIFRVPDSVDQISVAWDQGVGAGWSSFAVADGQAITLEQRDDQECLTCYRLTDGELLWIQEHEGRHENPLGGIGPRSTPTIAGDRVYAASATGFVWCVNRATGEILWTKDLLAIVGWDQTLFEATAPWGYAISPLLVDGKCVLALGGIPNSDAISSLVALDQQTGEEVWRTESGQFSYASPTLVQLDGVNQIVSVNESDVAGYQIDSGKTLWSFDWPGATNAGANCASAIRVGDDQILVGKGYSGGSALVQVKQSPDGNWSTEDIWRNGRILQTKFNHTCVRGNTGFAINNGALQAVDLTTEEVYWTQGRRSRAGQGQVVLAGDVLVLQDEGGDLVFVEATIQEYNELLRVPALSSKTWNIPTVAGRYVLVRNDRQAICFEMPER